MNQISRNENKFFNTYLEEMKIGFGSIIYGLETTKQNYKSIKDFLINFRDIEGEEKYQRKLDNYLNQLSKCGYGSDTELDLSKIDNILKKYNIDLDTVLKWGDEPPVGYSTNKWIKSDNYIALYDLLVLDKSELDMIFIESIDISTNREIDHASKENLSVYPFLNDYPTYREISTIRHFFEKAIKDFYVMELRNYILDDIPNNTVNQNLSLSTNPFPNIFKNYNAYLVFKKFSKEINEKSKLVGYSFIYRMMIDDSLIYDTTGPQDFKIFLNKEFNVDIDRIKRLVEISERWKPTYYQIKEANKPI